ncbi:MAG: hypothetical protein WCP24_00945 [bacterium]
MKKLSSKIIIFLLITAFFWSGASFNFEKINKAYAITAAEDACGPSGVGNTPGTADFRVCVNEFNMNPANIENGTASTTQYMPGVVYLTADEACAGSADLINCVKNFNANPANIANGTVASPEESYCRKKTNIPTGPVTGNAAYSDCIDQYRAAEVAGVNSFEGFGAFMSDWGKNAAKTLAEGALKTVLGVIGGLIQLIWVPVLGILLRIIAACLDLSIQFTLNSTNISGVNDAITTVWALVRNIFNITFIFILLYTAIRTIIGSASANTKKMIANVVIAALLINFSLFITRVLIDAGNILATALYNSATATGSISATMMNLFGIGTLWGTTGVGGGLAGVFSTPFFVISVLQIITITTAIITMGYVLLLMLTRNVMLIFLLVLSPIGFMGNVLPKIEEYSKMWRENLYGQVFMAPIFLLFFYLITMIGGKAAPAALTGENKDYAAYFKYVMIIILLFAAVKITKKMSGVVGAIVEKYASMAAGAAVGLATGGAALLATKTLGAGASALMNNTKFGEKLKGSNSFADRLALKALDKTSKSTFDARNTDAFKETAGLIGEHTGMKVDYNRGIKTKKDGFQGAVERNTKADEEHAKLVTKDMPGATDAQVAADRPETQRKIAAKAAIIVDLQTNNIPTDEEGFAERERQIAEHEKERARLEKRIKLSDKDLKKELEKEAKNARLEIQARAAENSLYNRLVGPGARKAAAKAIRKLGAEKSGNDMAAEAAKKLAEEAAASGNAPAAAPASTPAAPSSNSTPASPAGPTP